VSKPGWLSLTSRGPLEILPGKGRDRSGSVVNYRVAFMLKAPRGIPETAQWSK